MPRPPALSAPRAGRVPGARSAMAYRAVLQMIGVDVIARHKPPALRFLIGWRRPCHIEHLFLGPDVALGMAVTLQTPAHRQRLLLAHQRHPLHRAVTARTADS